MRPLIGTLIFSMPVLGFLVVLAGIAFVGIFLK